MAHLPGNNSRELNTLAGGGVRGDGLRFFLQDKGEEQSDSESPSPNFVG